MPFPARLKDEATPGLALGLSQKLHSPEPSAAVKGLIPPRGCWGPWEGTALSPGAPSGIVLSLVLVSGSSSSPSSFLPAELCLPPSLLLPQESLDRGLFPEHHLWAVCPILPKLPETVCTWDETNDGMLGFEGFWVCGTLQGRAALLPLPVTP